MYEVFFEEIKIIDFHKIQEGQCIKEFLQQHEFQKAFSLACHYCDLQAHETLKLIKILLLYRHGLHLNLTDALRWAVENNNLNLYHELSTRGAVNQQAELIASAKLRQVNASFANHYHPDFKKDYTSLSKLQVEKYQTDAQRIALIIKIIDFLIQYHPLQACFNKPLQNPSDFTLQILKDTRDGENRILLTTMCQLIQKLSPELRIKYTKSFDTSAFSWLTFEHFGGLMIEPSQSREALLPFPNQMMFLKSPELIQCANHFLGEVGDLQLLIPSAVTSIIEQDLPALRSFFYNMLKSLVNPEQPITGVSLSVTKCLTSYFNDILTLIRLLNLTSSSSARMKMPASPQNDVLAVVSLDCSPFNLSKKMEVHAALRRLQLLGELITSKFFSKFLIDLDPSTDWRAFITIRDAITHQDERDLKYRLSQFLTDKIWLESVFTQDLQEFWEKIVNLLFLRKQSLGAYSFDPDSYWQHLLAQSTPSQQQESNNNNKQEVDVPNSGNAMKQELPLPEVHFMKRLDDYKAPAHLIELCRKLFTDPTVQVTKLQKGAILACFPRKELGEEYKKLSATLDSAISKRSTLNERDKKRLDEKAASERKEAEKLAKLKGLEGIRKLADYLLEPVKKEHLLNPLKRVEAAIEGLLNIDEFLIDVGYWLPPMPLLTKAGWDKALADQGKLTLASLLVSNPKLNDAIEYNLGQVLQHLETIRTYKELSACPLITNSYSTLREFRNYLEHGNPLIDNQNEIYSQTDYKEKKIAVMVIQLLTELMPALMKEKARLETAKWEAKEWHPGALVTSREQEEWTMVCTSPNTLFTPAQPQKDPSRKNQNPMERPGDDKAPGPSA